MVRWCFVTRYPNGKVDKSEYRSYEENLRNAQKVKNWSESKGIGATVKMIKYSRIGGSSVVLETVKI